MSARLDARGAEVRVVEFDLLEDEITPVVAVEAEWLRPEAPARPRVLRGEVDGVDAFALPPIEAPYQPVVVAEPAMHDPDAGRRGAAAIAWGVAYREGHDLGQAEGFAQGHAEGFATGAARGRDEALRAGQAAAETTLRSLDTEARRTLAQLDHLAEEVASSATLLAFQIAELVLERELVLAADPGAEAVRRAARLLPDTGATDLEALVARLHPDDLQRLQAEPASLVRGRALHVLADPSVPMGSCLLEDGATRVDATIPAALGRVADALGLGDVS